MVINRIMASGSTHSTLPSLIARLLCPVHSRAIELIDMHADCKSPLLCGECLRTQSTNDKFKSHIPHLYSPKDFIDTSLNKYVGKLQHLLEDLTLKSSHMDNYIRECTARILEDFNTIEQKIIMAVRTLVASHKTHFIKAFKDKAQPTVHSVDTLRNQLDSTLQSLKQSESTLLSTINSSIQDSTITAVSSQILTITP